METQNNAAFLQAGAQAAGQGRGLWDRVWTRDSRGTGSPARLRLPAGPGYPRVCAWGRG